VTCTGTVDKLDPERFAQHGVEKGAADMIRKTVGLILVALFSGCNDVGETPSDLKITINESPKSAYLLDFKILVHPGPFKNIKISAFHRVKNSECVKAQPLSGAVLPPELHVPLTAKKVGDEHYQAVFHLDALQNDDYFGLGVCRWKLQNLIVEFESPTTKFLATWPNGKDGKQDALPQSDYYLQADYFKKPDVGTVVFGEGPDFYLEKMGPKFRVTLSARKLGS
jgi:hypothetical protein